MRSYYQRTVTGLLCGLVLLAATALLANSLASDARARLEHASAAGQSSAEASAAQRARTARLESAIGPVHEFGAAWRPSARLPEKEAADRIRSDLETIAQRQLGLVTDNAITPSPEKYSFQGVVARVQKVTLRSSGKDLGALLTWLGKLEEKYPAALIESCEFSSNVGGSTGLTVRLAQALAEPTSRHPMYSLVPTDSVSLPDAIAAIDWARYRPTRLKAPVPIGIGRNPLQPAVATETRSTPLLRDDADEITPRIENVLDARLRSVVRGAAPLIVIDGRVFRVGDEVVTGKGREKLVPDAKTKLKQIGDERLVLQITGGSADRPIQCDVSYELPSFLRSR